MKMVLERSDSEFIYFISDIFVVELYFEKTHLRTAQKYVDGRLLSVWTATNGHEQRIRIA
jgi:hypothetical protein